MWKRKKRGKTFFSKSEIKVNLVDEKRKILSGFLSNVENAPIFQHLEKLGLIRAFGFFHLLFHNLWKSEDVYNQGSHLSFFAFTYHANSLQMLLISYSKVLSPDILLLITSMEDRMVV